MTAAWLSRAALISTLVLLGHTAPAQLALKDKVTLDKRIDCSIFAVEATWRKGHDTLIHVRLKNRTGEALETELNDTLYLAPDSKLQPVPLWAPADLAHDAPAPTDVKEVAGGAGVSIRLKMQPLHIEPRSEAEFSIHAANMKWEREISSVWPNFELMKVAPAGKYSLNLILDTAAGSIESNTVKVAIVKE